ncbi:MAG TPA: hypothetical protein VF503_03395 [Sphingobium sp.]|uniref:hypothetical protein n=1 Tax=Sphingobium sp. TaxID=1912891 RepID=UPI002ED3C6CC
MAPLSFDLRHYSFMMALDALIDAFRVALSAMDDQLLRAHADMAAHGQYLATGGDDGAVYIDDHYSHDTADLLMMEHSDASSAARAIREAFVISLFHLWERSARSWVKCEEQSYAKLAKALRAAGLPIHQKMATLNDLSNFLKHANKSKRDETRRKLREYITGPLLVVNISDEKIEKIIGYIRASSPLAGSLNVSVANESQ